MDLGRGDRLFLNQIFNSIEEVLWNPIVIQHETLRSNLHG